jgi:hypothetical protein
MTIPPLFKSKRFWSALVGIILLIVTELSPDLGSAFSGIQEHILLIIGLLIGGYAIEDAIEAWRKDPPAQG